MRNKRKESFILFFIGTLFFFCQSCSTIPSTKPIIMSEKKNQDAFHVYGENIIYFNFDNFLSESLPEEKTPLPYDLEAYLNNPFHQPRVADQSIFEKDFWEEAKKLNYSKEDFEKFPPKQALDALINIITSRFDFVYVDNPPFTRIHGKSKPIEFYFHKGQGDCDKYSDATILGFKIIKKINPHLENIYLAREELGGNYRPHAWVSIIIPTKFLLLICHIDPTFSDTINKESLIADDYHIYTDYNIFKAYFYSELACQENYL